MSNFSVPDRFDTGFFDSDIAWDSRKPSKKRVAANYELEYITKDGGMTYIDNIIYPVKKNNIIFATPGQLRRTKVPYVCMYIKFDAEGLIKEQCNNIRNCMAAIHAEEIQELFKRVIFSNEKDTILVTASHFLKLFNKLIHEAKILENAISDRSNPEKIKAIANAKNFINLNYAADIDLNNIAEYVNLSPSYLHSIFSENEGVTPHRYLIRKRIDEAKILLLTENSIPLSDIAIRCGYASQSYFNYIFKKETGLTPTEYRKISAEKYFK